MQTCREIHQEAALLPYGDNVFAFFEPPVLEEFLRLLVPAQAHVIRSITLINPLSRSGLGTLVENKLCGLRQLTCFMEFDEIKRMDSFGTSEVYRREQASNILPFERAPIVEAAVVVRNTGDAQGKVSRELYNEWEEDIEERLTSSWKERQ